MTLEVGKKYIDGRGNTVELFDNDSDIYPFVGAYEDGKYSEFTVHGQRLLGVKSIGDLIEEITE